MSAASSAFPQPTPELLPPPVGPGVQTATDRTTQGSMSTGTGQHSDAFTSWSYPASATGQSLWTETTEVFLDEGPSVHGGPSAFGGLSVQGPLTAFPSHPLSFLESLLECNSRALLFFTQELCTRPSKEWAICLKNGCRLPNSLANTTSRPLRICKSLPRSLLIARAGSWACGHPHACYATCRAPCSARSPSQAVCRVRR